MNALFQSTFPLQGTTADQLQDRAAGRISIHVPIAGNDEDMLNNRLSEDNHISIHVPIAGNDAVGMASSSFLGIFQSTFPLQGTTVIIPFFCIIINISIHVPIAGNDIGLFLVEKKTENFNPRSHCRERLFAPGYFSTLFIFQSTFPLQGPTPVLFLISLSRYISIHVPIAGNDLYRLGHSPSLYLFQSTFPLQGTTISSSKVMWPFSFQSTFPLQGTTANLSTF